MKKRNNTGFASLDQYNTQQSIVERLSPELRTKWSEHRWTVLQSETPPFEAFVKWIWGQAMVHRLIKPEEPSEPARELRTAHALERSAPTQLHPTWFYQSQPEQPSHFENMDARQHQPSQEAREEYAPTQLNPSWEYHSPF